MEARKGFSVAAIALAILVLAGPGCRKSSTSPVTNSTGATSNQDAAQSIANAVGEDNGGVIDQMGDAVDATGSSGVAANVGSASAGNDGLLKGLLANSDSVTKTFNASDTSWTVFVSRSRTGLFGRQAAFTRTYYLKFIDANGVALPRYITTGTPDTATAIILKILDGTGQVITRYVSTHLLSISSSFVITGTNTPVVTVNGTFSRVGTDTVKTFSGLRVLNYTLTGTLTNVTRPRIPRYVQWNGVPRATSGTITGTYTATVSVISGSSYTERSFTKTFTITFGTDGTGSMDVDGTRFSCDLQVGEATAQ